MSETVKPYSSEGEGKKTQVSQMFDNIAPYYDFLNRLLTLRIDVLWRKKAISLLKKSQPNRILDVATGTADVAIMMSKQLKAEEIIGMDISKEMLAVGQKKIDKKGLDKRIKLEYGDSENLSYSDNSFDAVTVAFGVRNFEDLEKGLAEIKRVLKPGGQLVILEFSKPTVFPFKQGYNFYFKYILPNIGRFTSKDPKAYEYLYRSVQAFPDGDAFKNILQKIGFNNTQCTQLSLGICSIYTGQP
ncbi:MAG: bifunctional demethylmenaquinone methyltransferase/2-methoxy-6-polyprenyl-1,4-benzoquinol methylase UbiE [Saprospiraceae bacterium]